MVIFIIIECSILDSMHNGKKFSMDLDKLIRERIFFFSTKFTKIIREAIKNIFGICCCDQGVCEGGLASYLTCPSH